MTKAVLLLPVFVLALTATAFAQAVDKGKGATETVRITIGGTGDLDYIHRDRALSDWRLSGPGTADDTAQLAPNIWVRLDVELSDKVTAVVELGMDPVNTPSLGSDAIAPTFGQLYAQIAEMFDVSITLRMGQIWTDFDIRGQHNSIVFDSFYSESISLSQSPDGKSAADYGYSAGLVLDWNHASFSLQLAAFPRINDGVGNTHPGDTDSTYALSFFYNLDMLSKGSRIGVLAAIFGAPGNETGIITFGGGADLFFMDNNALEVYAEVYFQRGDAGSFGTYTLYAKGLAFQLGARYAFASDMKPWVELKLTYLSGDDDPADDSNDNFISREHERDLMILEDEVFGVDWDTNYFCIKLLAGLAFSAGGGIPNNLKLNAAIGFASANEDVAVATGLEDGLGTEADITMSWAYSKAANLTVGLGFLFGSDIMEGQTADAEGTTWLATLGANWKW